MWRLEIGEPGLDAGRCIQGRMIQQRRRPVIVSRHVSYAIGRYSLMYEQKIFVVLVALDLGWEKV